MIANNKKTVRPSAVKNFLIFCISVLFTSAGFANPQGGTVTAGSATISQSPNSTVIQQNSPQAIIEWNSFNIGPKETTHFQQPTNGIALNRINSQQGMTQIYGQLSATGRIILINAAGIYFGMGSVIHVGGLIASTSNISNANFLAGKYIFDQPSPFNAGIVNEGIIKAADYGLVALIGSSVTNHGMIQAELGSIILATGDKFTLDFYGDQLINFIVDARATSGGKIENSGSLFADGGKILVTAQAAQGVLDNVINMTGVAQARSVAQQGGQIIFSATGDIELAGELNASGVKGIKGGSIKISAPSITIAPVASIHADGAGGGNISLAANKVVVGGELSAIGNTATVVGGDISIAANTITLANHAMINVSGGMGDGTVTLTDATPDAPGKINVGSGTSIVANASNSGNAGTINLTADEVNIGGNLSAQGLGQSATGGNIVLVTNALNTNDAIINASGYAGGGNVSITAAASPQAYINIDSRSAIMANAMATGTAGDIRFQTNTINIDGEISAQGLSAPTMGGTIQIAANSIVASGATMTVSGGAGGGNVVVMGNNPNSYLDIDSHSVVTADALNSGEAGNINLASNDVTIAGKISAQGFNEGSVGGDIQVNANTFLAEGAAMNVRGGGGGGNVAINANSYINIDNRTTVFADAQISGKGGNIQFVAANATIDGEISAQGLSAYSLGGSINVMATSLIAAGAALNVSGGAGGGNVVVADSNPTSYIDIDSHSVILANAINSGKAGDINLAADQVTLAGSIDAQGYSIPTVGGNIQIAANTFISEGGQMNVSAVVAGGNVSVVGNTTANNANSINIDALSTIVSNAMGDNGIAGNINLYGDDVTVAGRLSAEATGTHSTGGNIGIHGHDLYVSQGAVINANADFTAGNLTIGGNPAAGTDASASVTVSATSTLSAEATGNAGIGGTIKVDADKTTIGGQVDTSGLSLGASGGEIQITGGNITVAPLAALNASGQQSGGEISVGSIPGSATSAAVTIAAGSTLNADAYGQVNPASASSVKGGTIQVYANNTTVNGKLDVSATAPNSAAQGGTVKVLANNTVTLGSSAQINAQGDGNGGLVFIGGDQHGIGIDPNAQFTNMAQGSLINTSSLTSGNGGDVVVWSNINTNYNGAILATGGKTGGNGADVEVSGKQSLNYQGSADLTASHGSTGTLTLDPQNITIQNVGPNTPNSSDSVLTVATLETMLVTANVLVITGTSGSAPGDITVANNVSWNNANTLTLSAYRNVDINATISNKAGGSVTVVADNTVDGVGSIYFGSNGAINLSGGGKASLTYEPSNNNFRYPNVYASNVNVSNGSTTAYYPLNYVTPADNQAIISSFSVVPNVLDYLGLAMSQLPLEVIVPQGDNTTLAMENNLMVITETAPAPVSVRLNDQPVNSGCGESATCVSTDFVIE